MKNLIIDENKQILKVRLILNDNLGNIRYMDISPNYEFKFHNGRCSLSFRNLQYKDGDIEWDLEEVLRTNDYKKIKDIFNKTVVKLVDIKVMYR